MSLIRLTPDKAAEFGHRFLVEVPEISEFVFDPHAMNWLKVSAEGRAFLRAFTLDAALRFARPAEPHEIPCEEFSPSLKVGAPIGVARTEITGDVLSDSGNGVAERPASPETLPDETAPTPLNVRSESDLTAHSGGSSRSSNKPLTFGRYMVEPDGKAWEIDGKVSIALASTPENYALLQSAWCEHFGVKVGTRVMVVRRASSGVLGWGQHWSTAMHADVGRSATVEAENGTEGVLCLFEKGDHSWFPFHVLEVLEPQPLDCEVCTTPISDKAWPTCEKCDPQPEPQRVNFWAVTVSMNGETLLTIDTDMSGKSNLSETEMGVIRKAGEHLLGFAGSGEHAPFFDPEKDQPPAPTDAKGVLWKNDGGDLWRVGDGYNHPTNPHTYSGIGIDTHLLGDKWTRDLMDRIVGLLNGSDTQLAALREERDGLRANYSALLGSMGWEGPDIDKHIAKLAQSANTKGDVGT
jgi:hypothetical protein